MYHWQITFVMLNRFCLLRKTSQSLLLMNNIKLDGIPSIIKWKVLQVLFIKSSFLSCYFIWVFTSADIVLYSLFEIHLTLSEKKIFFHGLSFFNGFTQTPHRLNDQNLLSMMEFFVHIPWRFVRNHCQILLVPSNHWEKNWIAQFLLILEAKFSLPFL